MNRLTLILTEIIALYYYSVSLIPKKKKEKKSIEMESKIKCDLYVINFTVVGHMKAQLDTFFRNQDF